MPAAHPASPPQGHPARKALRGLQERRAVEALTASAARPRWALVGVVAAATVAVDQATKSWALAALDDRAVDVVWTLRLALHFNSGAAFSIGRGMPWLFAVGGCLLVVGLLVAVRGMTSSAMAAAIGLVVGGAVGNLVDRFFRDHDGAVVDFIDLGWWPVFNVADMAIVTGAVLLVLAAGRSERRDGAASADATPPTAGEA